MKLQFSVANSVFVAIFRNKQKKFCFFQSNVWLLVCFPQTWQKVNVNKCYFVCDILWTEQKNKEKTKNVKNSCEIKKYFVWSWWFVESISLEITHWITPSIKSHCMCCVIYLFLGKSQFESYACHLCIILSETGLHDDEFKCLVLFNIVYWYASKGK